MRKDFKRSLILCVCVMMLAGSFLTPIAHAATGVYEITFDNLFLFEQWANHPNLKVNNTGDEALGTITTDIENGSFSLKNSATTEVFTAFSMGSVGAFYSMPVEENTEYVFSYNANGSATQFETFVFYFNEAGNYTSLTSKQAQQSGHTEWSFITPEDTKYIQVRFDNNQPGTTATYSNIKICSKDVYENVKNAVYRKAFSYADGTTYGDLPVPEREGLVFAGWFTGPNGTGRKITSSSVMTPTSKCLYSKWDPIVEKDLLVVSLPLKQDYCVGEKLNTKGLVIKVTYPDGKKENIDEGFYCSPEILTEAGQQKVLVTYGGGSTEFTVNVKSSETKTIKINDTQKKVDAANYHYNINYSGSSFNQYEIYYSSDSYVKGELNFNGTIEEFFLEPATDGEFSSYIDGFLDGKTQSVLTDISFTPLDKEYMDFEFTSVCLNKIEKLEEDANGLIPLSNDAYKIGIDLKWGGALTYLEDKKNNIVSAKSNQNSSEPTGVGYYDNYDGTYKSGCDTLSEYTTQGNVNLINANDTGRLVQQSYYGTGSYPYEIGDYNGTPWNYNPVQGGNVKNEPSKIVDLKVTENEIYVKCQPLDWGKYSDEYAKANNLEKKYGDDYITPSYMEAWYTLENGMMRATCRFVDFSGYPSVTTTQELPAFYCVEPLNDFVYYAGGEAWSDSNTMVNRSDLGFWGTATDQDFICNENWAAFKGDNNDSFAIGIYCPGQTLFHTGVYYGVDGVTRCSTLDPATEGPTSYIGVVDTLQFESYTPISYCYYISTGNVEEIRSSFKSVAQTEEDICNATATNGFCDMCGKCTAPKLNENNVYEISNAGELHWFRDKVNSGKITADAVLTCDITDNAEVLSEYGTLTTKTTGLRNWTPIGTLLNPYEGTFDGQGYTINGLYMSNSSLSYGGLFGYTTSTATIKRVGIDNSFFFGDQCIGGICGQNDGAIENCYTYNVFTRGSSYVGGITGKNNGNVKNCYNMGIVNANNYIGAIAGDSTATAINNCHYLVNAATDGSGITQYGIGNASKGSATADKNYKTVEQFASGEVAYLLQELSSQQLWGQKTNTLGSAPVFDTTGKYAVNGISGHNNYSLVNIGDLDGDADIDRSDYQQVINKALSREILSLNDMVAADIDGDGYLTVIDCAFMSLMTNGLLDKVDVYQKGDYDCDGIPFTTEDVNAIKKALINQDKLNTRQKYACDLNFDGELDIKDRDILTECQDKIFKEGYTNIEEVIENRTKTANVIILCGQSNAYGASPLTPEIRGAVGNTDFSNVKIKYTNINSDDGTNNWRVHYSNSAFETYRLGIGGQADAWFGPELGISYYLATNEETKNQDWYIIKCTAAGSFLGGNWIIDDSGTYSNAITYENVLKDIGVSFSVGTINLVNADLQEIENKHGVGNINIRSFMWMQGESDAGFEQWANQYGELQNLLVNNMRTAFAGKDNDGKIPFIDGAIAAYKEGINTWTYSNTVNTAKANNATHWFVPKNTTGNVINQTTAGVYLNTSGSTTQLTNSLWVDTSTCLSKLENNNENGENDGAHYCGASMLDIGMWFAMGISVFP